MKIRTDFVTNSSSSNFTIAIKAESLTGETVEYECDLSRYSEDGDNVGFDLDMKKYFSNVPLALSRFSNSEELASLLMDAVHNGLEDWDNWGCDEDDEEDEEKDEDDDWYDPLEMSDSEIAEEISEEKAAFVNEVSRKMPRIQDISRIVIIREQRGWGEGSNMAVDDYLSSYINEVIASNYSKSSLAELRKALETVETGRLDEYDMDWYWLWDGKDSSLRALVKRNENNWGPGETVGREYRILDIQAKSYNEYIEFVVQ